MAGQVLEIKYPLDNADQTAVQISNYWQTWDTLRNAWIAQRRELRNYLFATDTTTTTNSALPWKNKTTLPKLTQIRDNLHANYLSALFPNDDWLIWEGDDEVSVSSDKKKAIEGYMKTKVRLSMFEDECSRLLLDYIDTGNAFAFVDFERNVLEKTVPVQDKTNIYIGPKMHRIAPQDIVFNPHAESFTDSPKIIRSVMTIGDLLKEMEIRPDMGYDKEAFQKMMDYRHNITEASARGDTLREDAARIDGFGGWSTYFQSGFVELLTFYGDIYDCETGALERDRIIVVADRNYVLCNKENPSWLGRSPIHHVGWRSRTDNLWAMGPLDNLVGLQYRIDHLENLKADAVDMVVFPVLKIRGDVEDFDYGPLERIYVHDEGDVEFMHPDVAALQINSEIDVYEARMELYAGAPKDAMGVRTPGEKTAYEVEQLQTAAGRIFQIKINQFEKFLEGVINDMHETSIRNLQVEDTVKLVDSETGVQEFLTVNKQALTGKGHLRPVGARHFAAVAKSVQELTAFTNSALGQDESIKVHFSGFKMAQTIEQLLGMQKFKLVQKNVRLLEQYEQQQMMNQIQEQLQVESQMPVEEAPMDLGMQGGMNPGPMPEA